MAKFKPGDIIESNEYNKTWKESTTLMIVKCFENAGIPNYKIIILKHCNPAEQIGTVYSFRSEYIDANFEKIG